ncbi:MAG: GNAT family protein [bacterium]|nr:GNAT family protein [bacterium]
MCTLIEDRYLKLVPYTHDDDKAMYKCLKDKATQLGFNYIVTESFQEFSSIDLDFYPFWAVIIHKKSNQKIGCLRLSPFKSNPDLSIWIYKQYRRKGLGTRAYMLGLTYCFETLHLSEVVAGSYEYNEASRHILAKLGFKRVPSHDLNERSVITGKPIKQIAYQLDKSTFESLSHFRNN